MKSVRWSQHEKGEKVVTQNKMKQKRKRKTNGNKIEKKVLSKQNKRIKNYYEQQNEIEKKKKKSKK